MGEIQDGTSDPWPSLAIAIGLVTAHRAGLEVPGEQAPGGAVDGLITIISALLDVLMTTSRP